MPRQNAKKKGKQPQSKAAAAVKKTTKVTKEVSAKVTHSAEPKMTNNAKTSASGSRLRAALLLIVPVALIFIVFFTVVLPGLTNVPFSTFKSNFDSAKNVAIVVTYFNTSQYISQSQCFSTAIQVVAGRRNASSIGFYILNQTNCTYSPTGLGHGINVSTTTKAYCLNLARSVPTVYLNYSASNGTLVKAYDLYVYGNSAYWAGCPIAVELS